MNESLLVITKICYCFNKAFASLLLTCFVDGQWRKCSSMFAGDHWVA